MQRPSKASLVGFALAMTALVLGGCAADVGDAAADPGADATTPSDPDGKDSDDDSAAGSDDAGVDAPAPKEETEPPPPAFDTSVCEWEDGIPPGSYLDSCQFCSVENGVLSCLCQGSAGVDGGKLTLTSCPTGDVRNCNGKLTLDTCFEANGQGSCDLRATHDTCSEYERHEVEKAQVDCATSGGFWSNQPCPIEEARMCCAYDNRYVCGYTAETRNLIFDACWALNICSCATD